MPNYIGLKTLPTDSEEIKILKKRTVNGIFKLQKALRSQFLASHPHVRNLKLATWNIREFGNSKYGGRDKECFFYIAEIISHFDIVALQEIRSDLKEFKELERLLGPEWSYLATDVTDGDAGNGERMVFVYNQQKVQFKNIAGELTLEEGNKIKAAFGERIKLENGLKLKLPAGVDLSGTYDASIESKGDLKALGADLEIELPLGTSLELPPGSKLTVSKKTEIESPGKGKAKVIIPNIIEGKAYKLRFPENSFDDSLRQFARTPFLISFQMGWLQLNLCTVHIYYGDDSKQKMEQRRSEIEKLTAALAHKAQNELENDPESFLCVLGDFNIIGKGHPTMEALESNNFKVPDKLQSIPGSNVDRTKAYDQIAFWEPKRPKTYAKLEVLNANVFDYFEHVFTFDDEATYRTEKDHNGLKDSSRYKDWRTYKMSDHLPMWVELRADFAQEYLENILK